MAAEDSLAPDARRGVRLMLSAAGSAVDKEQISSVLQGVFGYGAWLIIDGERSLVSFTLPQTDDGSVLVSHASVTLADDRGISFDAMTPQTFLPPMPLLGDETWSWRLAGPFGDEQLVGSGVACGPNEAVMHIVGGSGGVFVDAEMLVQRAAGELPRPVRIDASVQVSGSAETLTVVEAQR